MPDPPKSASGTERQRRYRASRRLVSIDVHRTTADTLAALRARTGLTTDAVIAASLSALTVTLDAGEERECTRAEPGSGCGGPHRVPTNMRPSGEPSPGDTHVDAVAGQDPGAQSARRAGVKTAKTGESGTRRRKSADGGRATSAPAPQPQGSLNLFGDAES